MLSEAVTRREVDASPAQQHVEKHLHFFFSDMNKFCQPS